MFVIREFHICYKDRGSRRCLLSGRFTSIIGRGSWKMFAIREFHTFYKDTMLGVWYKGDLHMLGELDGRCLS